MEGMIQQGPIGQLPGNQAADAPSGEGTEEDAQKEEMSTELAALKESVSSLTAQNDTLTQLVSDTRLAQAPTVVDEKPPEPDAWPEERELELMDKRQYGDLLTGRMVKAVQAEVGELLKPVSTQLKELADSQSASQAQTAATSARGEFADFDQWLDEMKAILGAGRATQLKDAYVLARGENSTKAKQIDDKAAEAKKVEAGGSPLRPGGTQTQSPERLGQEEAALSAYKELGPGIEATLASLET